MKRISILSQLAGLLILLAGCVPSKPISNLVKNGDFSRSMDGWLTIGQGTNPYHPGDPGRADYKVRNGWVEVDIRDQGFNTWSLILYQSVMFEKGATYTVSFDAKADPGLKIISNITQDISWRNISGDQSFQLTGKSTRYSYRFRMTEGGAALLQFCLGKAGIGKIYFDNIVIEKK
ncbi:MAG TPA: carbohydrate binding domain-containing protein [Anaerolineales bacterium]|nr:carbohydrate binding domain-containing protein [Anaerolineales bacterium]